MLGDKSEGSYDIYVCYHCCCVLMYMHVNLYDKAGEHS